MSDTTTTLTSAEEQAIAILEPNPVTDDEIDALIAAIKEELPNS